MNYSIIGHVAAKYSLRAIQVGMFLGGCFISYGFGLVRGERRVYNEIDRSLGIMKKGIELIIDEKAWKEALKKEMEPGRAHPQ